MPTPQHSRLSEEDSGKIKKIAAILKNTQNIFFVTGAGISAESGLPTYRGTGGLYSRGKTEDGIYIEDALSGEMLRQQPRITWKYLAEIERKCSGANYNDAHKIIAEMEKKFNRVIVLTQNIDGLHHAAGSMKVIDIHGDLHELVCTRCGNRKRVESYSGLEMPVICDKCSGPVRPDVVFFGEMLPEKKVNKLEWELEKGFDIYFTIGTTSSFPYISWPIKEAKIKGKVTVEIDPAWTPLSSLVDYKISATAGTAMTALWKEINDGK